MRVLSFETITVDVSGTVESIAEDKASKVTEALKVINDLDGQVISITELVINSSHSVSGSDSYGEYDHTYSDRGIIVTIYYQYQH